MNQRLGHFFLKAFCLNYSQVPVLIFKMDLCVCESTCVSVWVCLCIHMCCMKMKVDTCQGVHVDVRGQLFYLHFVAYCFYLCVSNPV